MCSQIRIWRLTLGGTFLAVFIWFPLVGLVLGRLIASLNPLPPSRSLHKTSTVLEGTFKLILLHALLQMWSVPLGRSMELLCSQLFPLRQKNLGARNATDSTSLTELSTDILEFVFFISITTPEAVKVFISYSCLLPWNWLESPVLTAYQWGAQRR